MFGGVRLGFLSDWPLIAAQAHTRRLYLVQLGNRELCYRQDTCGKTRTVLRLVWPSILLQSARDRVATATETVTVSRLWSAMSVKQRK